MIEHAVIDGRKAVVIHMNDEFEPVERSKETLIKIMFEDGEVRFAVPSGQKS
jgi:hypothetical protein